MEFVKKWLGSIVSFILGLLGLALSACSGMIASVFIDATGAGENLAAVLNQSSKETTKAFEVITDGSLYSQAKTLGVESEFVALKVFAIFTLILSILLIIFALIKCLQNLNVIKSTHIAFTIVEYVLYGLTLIAVIGLLICSYVYANSVQDVMLSMLKLSISSSLSLMGLPSSIMQNIIIDVSVVPGAYQWTMFALTLPAIAANATMFIINKKN